MVPRHPSRPAKTRAPQDDGERLMRLSSGSNESRRLLLRLNELAADQALGDLDRIEGGALAQVIGNDPHREPVFHSRILANAADIGRVLAGAFIGRDVAARLALVDDEAARRTAQDLARLVRRD